MTSQHDDHLKEPNMSLAPVVQDMSIYIIAGRVKATAPAPRGYFHVRQVYEDALEAEQLGFRRVFLSERHGLKDSGAVLGGVAARTTRLELATGSYHSMVRHPLVTAGWGATMQALNGPRLILGLGRGDPLWMGAFSFDSFVEFAKILRRLWAGETVTYPGPRWPDGMVHYYGPAGGGDKLRMDDVLDEVPPPQLWYCMLHGGPKAARAAADPVWDGVVLYPFLTPEAVARAVERIRGECERIGRDPSTLHIAHCIATAPDLDDDETRALCHARLLTYLDWASGFGDTLARANGWSKDVVQAIRDHEQIRPLQSQGIPADQKFHRWELLEPAKLIPDVWIEDVCAVGSVEDCVRSIERFRAIGVDETIIYGSRPRQNATLIAAWRDRRRQSA
jgi:5,10-methylenetetrahydromethanopterin reductase